MENDSCWRYSAGVWCVFFIKYFSSVGCTWWLISSRLCHWTHCHYLHHCYCHHYHGYHCYCHDYGRLRTVSLFSVVCWAKRDTRKWPRMWLMARDGRGTKKETMVIFVIIVLFILIIITIIKATCHCYNLSSSSLPSLILTVSHKLQ